jgi:hypothetical protein
MNRTTKATIALLGLITLDDAARWAASDIVGRTYAVDDAATEFPVRLARAVWMTLSAQVSAQQAENPHFMALWYHGFATVQWSTVLLWVAALALEIDHGGTLHGSLHETLATAPEFLHGVGYGVWLKEGDIHD